MASVESQVPNCQGQSLPITEGATHQLKLALSLHKSRYRGQFMRKQAGIATVVAIAMEVLRTSPSHASGSQLLTSDGLGSVKWGMSVRQVEAALGASLSVFPNSYGSYEACETAKRTDGLDAGLWFMFEAGQLTRIDVSPPDGTRSRLAISAQMGIGVGSEEVAVKRTYGTALRIEPHSDFNLLEVFEKG